MSNKTPLIANVVERYTGRDGSEQSHWTDVGIAFPHKSGEGFNLVIRQGLAVSGTIVLTTKKAREEAEGGAAPEAANFPEES
ncbi:hypothetical protein NO430_21975 (plasmid) [Xanthomonas oryzae pv. oryzae]|uniref:hypothetical protein n=1 Tax=Xanthomonas oryzae TaxID=347 RepID=UPI00217D4126|nr:hypothetical protein [Xanthomonas oryzae]UWI58955.1 hypothetical protein NO430_21975 [Xanthomonas oryzae pv. oryzae]